MNLNTENKTTTTQLILFKMQFQNIVAEKYYKTRLMISLK